MKYLRIVVVFTVALGIIVPALVLAAAPANPIQGGLPVPVAAPAAPVEDEAPEDEEDDLWDEAAYDALMGDEGHSDEDWELEFDALDDVMLDIMADSSLDLGRGIRHILLVGLDARPGRTVGRSDTMIIVTIDNVHKKLKLTTLMRDMYVDIPNRGGNRINSAWVYGGHELLLSTIKQNFGIEIEGYVSVNFSIMAQLVDAIGGIPVDIVSKAQMNAINDVIKEDNVVLKLKTRDGLLTETGEQLLTGKQAQAYARYRKLDSDFQRTERQREVIIKCMEKVMGLSLDQMLTLITDNIEYVDTDLSINDIMGLMPSLILAAQNDVGQLRLPVDGGYSSRTVKGMSVLVPDLSQNRSALEAFIKSE